MTNKEKIKRAEKLIDDFQYTFYKEVGVVPDVCYDIYVDSLPKLLLPQIEEAVNYTFKLNFPEAFPNQGIRNRARHTITIAFRYIFFKIARDMGYTFPVMSSYIGFDHATILHAVKSMNNLLETKDPVTIKYYNLVKNEIKRRVVNNADVHNTEQ
jgi:hypothetical protein